MNRHTIFARPYLLAFGTARSGGDRLSTTRSASSHRTAQWRFIGKQVQTDGKTFLHRGHAARHFLRRFVRSSGIEVRAAALENGLLRNDFARRQIQPNRRTVKIKIGGLS